jgi:hypothetical protein
VAWHLKGEEERSSDRVQKRRAVCNHTLFPLCTQNAQMQLKKKKREYTDEGAA